MFYSNYPYWGLALFFVVNIYCDIMNLTRTSQRVECIKHPSLWEGLVRLLSNAYILMQRLPYSAIAGIELLDVALNLLAETSLVKV